MEFDVKAKFNSEKESAGWEWKALKSFMESNPHSPNRVDGTCLQLLLFNYRRWINISTH
jgi:hypothetical protein